jgi:hypothetical protein
VVVGGFLTGRARSDLSERAYWGPARASPGTGRHGDTQTSRQLDARWGSLPAVRELGELARWRSARRFQPGRTSDSAAGYPSGTFAICPRMPGYPPPMAWNKRGSTSGGASTGRDGIKRGGKGGSAGSKGNPDTEKDYGKRGAGRSPDLDAVETADCTACNGTGYQQSDRAEVDEDGGFTGTQTPRCATCDGTGRVTKHGR